MDVAVLLLLPLVGGYVFSSTWLKTKYSSAREEGHRLYFRAAFWGIALFLLGLALHLYALAWWQAYRGFVAACQSILGAFFNESSRPGPVPVIIASTFALLIAYPAAGLLNLLGRRYKDEWIRDAIRDDYMEWLLHDAALARKPVAVTMENRKVYIGFVLKTLEPKKARRSISLLPLVSGYREETAGKLVFTTYYLQIYGTDTPDTDIEQRRLPKPLEHLSPNDFEMVLPVEKVHSLSRFDLTAYAAFQKQALPEG